MSIGGPHRGRYSAVQRHLLAITRHSRGFRDEMKLPLLLIPLLAITAGPQNVTKRPCIAFSPESSSATNDLAKDQLEAAVNLSGDFQFFASRQEGCWNVHVISFPVMSGKGKRIGYAISHTVTDPQNVEVGHALTFGPDQDIFLQAMRKATADAIRNIRLARSLSQSPTTTH